MAALIALAVRLAGLGADALGIRLEAFALLAGLALGALPAGFLGHLIGQSRGIALGSAATAARCEANTLARDLAEARLDASTARAASAAARADAFRNAAVAAHLRDRNDAYARELAARGPGGACGLSDADVRVLRGNGWAVQVRPGGARPPGGR